MGNNLNKVSFAGTLIALGIIYGDIGTSPLYVFNTIIANRVVSRELILGTLSLIIWTMTIITTVKYVIMILRADNKGEGGIFALFALVRRRRKWLVIPAIIGGGALLADGIITPPISITSAVEGLRKLPAFDNLTTHSIVIIVLAIISLFFFAQQFGTEKIGKFFGPIMTCWFLLLGILGVIHIYNDTSILKAFNPYYAIHFLYTFDGAYWLLGAVFLCTTGAEALYSDLGHCGRDNIRVSWMFVKVCLILNYLGQGASLLKNHSGKLIDEHARTLENINAFYDMMPAWFVGYSVVIATSAAIIASQAMVTGSFTLINEAIRLNLWPRIRTRYPSEAKGQIFIPGINLMLFSGCVLVVLYFQESYRMEAAYGLAIIITMLATTILFANYLVMHRVNKVWIWLFLLVYVSIEFSYLIALMAKFPNGGYFSILIGFIMFSVMYVWFRARKIKNRYVEFVRVKDYIPKIEELSNDSSVPKYATHLVYLTSAKNHNEIEHKITYSILNGKPKRADIYWFVHVDTTDDPYTMEYLVDHIIPNDIIRVEFKLGFRVPPRINLMFKKVVEDLVTNREVNITSRYDSLQKNNVVGDFQFIVMEKFLSQENELPFMESLIMKIYFYLKKFSTSEEKSFGLEQSNVLIEKFPLVVAPIGKLNLKRRFYNEAEGY